MNPLFTLGEEFRFHDSSRFRKKVGDAKLRFYHSFVPVLMSLMLSDSFCLDSSIGSARRLSRFMGVFSGYGVLCSIVSSREAFLDKTLVVSLIF